MLKKNFILCCLLALSLSAAAQSSKSKDWAWTDFVRPAGVNPVMSPTVNSLFYCPMQGKPMMWEESDTFNPAATVMNGRVVLLYRAEDNSATGIGRRTSRIGYASSSDGLHFERHGAPVLYPNPADSQAEFECPDRKSVV